MINSEDILKISEICISIDKEYGLPVVFINVKSEEVAQQINEKFIGKAGYNKIIYPKGVDKNLNKTLLL